MVTLGNKNRIQLLIYYSSKIVHPLIHYGRNTLYKFFRNLCLLHNAVFLRLCVVGKKSSVALLPIIEK
jgi:hypothetical protein